MLSLLWAKTAESRWRVWRVCVPLCILLFQNSPPHIPSTIPFLGHAVSFGTSPVEFLLAAYEKVSCYFKVFFAVSLCLSASKLFTVYLLKISYNKNSYCWGGADRMTSGIAMLHADNIYFRHVIISAKHSFYLFTWWHQHLWFKTWGYEGIRSAVGVESCKNVFTYFCCT